MATKALMSVRRKFGPHKIFVLLLAVIVLAVANAHRGLWDAPLPLGDESVYIEQAFRAHRDGEWSWNPYLFAYRVVFDHLNDDPISAHLLMRFLSSLLSALGVFVLLTSLRFVSPAGAFALTLLWNQNRLNIPIVQAGNVHLFCFALTCLLVSAWLRSSKGSWVRTVATGGLFIPVLIRPEYVLLPIVLILRSTLAMVLALRRNQFTLNPVSWRVRHWCVGSAILLLLVVSSMSPNLRTRTADVILGLERYLFLGLRQGYAVFIVNESNLTGISPYTEFGPIMEKAFPGANGFMEALFVNPPELLRYLSRNAIANGIKVQAILRQHTLFSSAPPQGVQTPVNTWEYRIENVLVLLFVFIGGVWLVRAFGQVAQGSLARAFFCDESVAVIVGLAAVALPALLVLVPNPRYWIDFIPLFFWGSAALLSRAIERAPLRFFGPALVIATLLFSRPPFSESMNQGFANERAFLLTLRAELARTGYQEIRVLGWWPARLCTYAAPGTCNATNIWDIPSGKSFESLLVSRYYDLVFFEPEIRATALYNSEMAFFRRFENDPQQFGYSVACTSSRGETAVYRRRR